MHKKKACIVLFKLNDKKYSLKNSCILILNSELYADL